MRNAFLLTFIGIIVVSLLTIGAVYALPQETPPELTPLPSASDTASAVPDHDLPYLLRSYQGKLAVFTSDLVQPDMVFDVYVRTLPEYDQTELERGVRVASYEELTSLIEDYIS